MYAEDVLISISLAFIHGKTMFILTVIIGYINTNTLLCFNTITHTLDIFYIHTLYSTVILMVAGWRGAATARALLLDLLLLHSK